MSMMSGKRAVILGVANDHSIAWAIARALHREGASLAFNFPNEAIEKRVRPLAESLGAAVVLPCDVSSDEQITAFFATLKETWPEFDILVHAVAFAQKDELKGRFVNTSREGFRTALDVSAYSLIAAAREAEALLVPRRGSILTLSYFGAEKVIPNYNVMGVAKAALESCVRYLAADLGPAGVRVNAISAGPLRTLSSAGISGFKEMLHHHEERSPLRRRLDADEIGDAALYLCSDLARSVTGEVHHVDGGYNVLGM